MKTFLTNALVLMVTLLLMLGLSEVVIRQFLDPLDYLQPTVVADAELGHRIDPGTGGHDGWGFRNRAVPERADLVFIGDSMVYGTATSYEASIPARLESALSRKVYGLALGGYGAPHYDMLMDRALSLHPRTVLVGVSFGNNFMHAFNFVYSPQHARYAALRQPQFAGATTFEAVETRAPEGEGAMRSLRNWLARHSVLYRAVTTRLDFWRAFESRHRGSDVLLVQDAGGALVTTISLHGSARVDPTHPQVQEGLRITATLVESMKRKADSSGVRFAVVLFPTQFSSYDALLSSDPRFPPGARKAVTDEARLFTEVLARMQALGVETIDLRPPLKEAIAKGQHIYPVNDGHPNAVGNRLIAEYLVGRLGQAAAK